MKLNTRTVVVVAVLVMVLPIAYSVVRFAAARTVEPPQVFLEKPIAAFQNCVEDATYMRYRHMELLKKTREDVIRHGIRSGVTLSGCGRCHVNRDRFCNRCHEAASVVLDCFGCHYYPDSASDAQQAGS